ncbi:hypothetical protein RHGRI_033671 [Rhododendron griersonianum]|uniref:UDP-glucose/GDP-mannose dehydrogenase C-terminal domain-containing protein n=1 Tax=Rhododendron griersonianum TaxID=479676 RepID=A0AAV6I202_9ERIC|nr:hypothetical protein RHGRI_033671 [Rhododendron griersonianum]
MLNSTRMVEVAKWIKAGMVAIRDRVIVVFGVSYKNGTGDIKESQAIEICKLLLKQGAILRLFDPNAQKGAVRLALGARIGNQINWFQNFNAAVCQHANPNPDDDDVKRGQQPTKVLKLCSKPSNSCYTTWMPVIGSQGIELLNACQRPIAPTEFPGDFCLLVGLFLTLLYALSPSGFMFCLCFWLRLFLLVNCFCKAVLFVSLLSVFVGTFKAIPLVHVSWWFLVYDMAGVVVEGGSSIPKFEIGDEVFGNIQDLNPESGRLRPKGTLA